MPENLTAILGILTNVLWIWILAINQSRGYKIHLWYVDLRNLSNFKEIIEKERSLPKSKDTNPYYWDYTSAFSGVFYHFFYSTYNYGNTKDITSHWTGPRAAQSLFSSALARPISSTVALYNQEWFYNKRKYKMKTFPKFIKNPINMVGASQQNTADIEGYYFQGSDEAQIAFWECHADRVSKKHIHPFDEYMVCVSGEYKAYLNEKEIILRPGDELYIPKGTEQWGKCVAGTRTIHAFGGKRIIK